MRTLLIVSMIFSLSAFGQTRVRENIKQQSIITEDGEVKVLKKVAPAVSPAVKVPVKQVKQ